MNRTKQQRLKFQQRAFELVQKFEKQKRAGNARSVFPLEDDRDDAEAADAGGEEAEEDVGRRDEPEGEEIDGLVAVVGIAGVVVVHVWLVDSIHPDAT